MNPKIVYIALLIATLVACIAYAANPTLDDIKKAGDERVPRSDSLVDRSANWFSNVFEDLKNSVNPDKAATKGE